MHQLLKETLIGCYDPEQFIEEMCERGIANYSFENYLEGDAEYHHIVKDLCHNACAWMMLRTEQYKSFGEDFDMSKFFWCHGKVLVGTNERWDHSWIEYRDGDETIVFDLTIAQFYPMAKNGNEVTLFVGPRMSVYLPNDREATFSDRDTIRYFIDEACGD